MWQLDNQTPFAAQGAWVRDRDGREVWQVVVKATYGFDPSGVLDRMEDQPPVNLACIYRSEPGVSSLRYESDFALEKLSTDIVLNGSAWAPDHQHVTRLLAGFAVGALHKTVQVTGPRYWRQGHVGLIASDPEPFSRLPLIWENAYGGVQGVHPETGFPVAYPENPVGVGYHVKPETAHNAPLPCIEIPGKEVQRWSDRPVPAGVAPVAGDWSPRRELGGSFDERWRASRFPLLPEDCQPGYWQYAPADQQYPGWLQGGEAVRLVHLCPESDIRLRLPRLAFVFLTSFSDRPVQAHDARITALILEPDDCRFSLVYQTDLPCQGWEDDLLVTRIELDSSA